MFCFNTILCEYFSCFDLLFGHNHISFGFEDVPPPPLIILIIPYTTSFVNRFLKNNHKQFETVRGTVMYTRLTVLYTGQRKTAVCPPSFFLLLVYPPLRVYVVLDLGVVVHIVYVSTQGLFGLDFVALTDCPRY